MTDWLRIARRLKKAGLALAVAMAVELNFYSISFGATSAQTGMPVTVQPLLPSNQNSRIRGYFDLQVSPGQMQTVKVRIINPSASSIRLNIKPANALTAVNGGIQYQPNMGSDIAKLLSSRYAMKNRLRVVKSVYLRPHQQKDISIQIHVPDESSGTFLGGIIVLRSNATSVREKSPSQESFQVQNQVALAIALQLDLPKTVSPQLKFGQVRLQQTPSGSELTWDLSNAALAVAKDVSGQYKVINKRGKTILSGKFGPFTMAPESQISYPVLWQDASPGTYTVQLSATVQKQKIEVSKQLTLQNSKAKGVFGNTQATVRMIPQYWKTLRILFWILFLILAVAFGYVLGRIRYSRNNRHKGEPR